MSMSEDVLAAQSEPHGNEVKSPDPDDKSSPKESIGRPSNKIPESDRDDSVTRTKSDSLVEAPQCWRNADIFNNDDAETDLLRDVVIHEPQAPIQKANILLIGRVGSGKSSFINSISSILKGEVHTVAFSKDETNTSVTTKYDEYNMEKDGKEVHFTLFDTMGLEEEENGLQVEAAYAMIDGKLPPKTPLQHPVALDQNEVTARRIHLVLLVIKMDGVNLLMQSQDILKKYNKISKYAQDKNVHCAALLTKADKCENGKAFAKNNQLMYSDEEVECNVETLSGQLDLAKDDMLPIVNYTTHEKMQKSKNINILYAMKRMLNLCVMSIRTNYEELSSGLDCDKRKNKTGPTNPLLESAWRNSFEMTKDELLEAVTDHQVQYKTIKRPNVLLLGQIQVGKSSLVNSLASVGANRIKHPAKVGNKPTSVSKELKNFKFAYNLVILDVMGIDTTPEKGLADKDIKSLIQGKIKDKYAFNPMSAIKKKDSQYYRPKPSENEKPHVLALVIDSDIGKTVTDAMWDKLKHAKATADEKELQVCVILTKIDLLDVEIAKDVKKADLSWRLKEAVADVADRLEMNESAVYYVKNYTDEIVLNDDKSTLLLQVVKRFQELADDAIEARQEPTSSSNDEHGSDHISYSEPSPSQHGAARGYRSTSRSLPPKHERVVPAVRRHSVKRDVSYPSVQQYRDHVHKEVDRCRYYGEPRVTEKRTQTQGGKVSPLLGRQSTKAELNPRPNERPSERAPHLMKYQQKPRDNYYGMGSISDSSSDEEYEPDPRFKEKEYKQHPKYREEPDRRYDKKERKRRDEPKHDDERRYKRQPKYRDVPDPRYDEKERKRRDDPRYDNERQYKQQSKYRDEPDPRFKEKEDKRRNDPRYDDDEQRYKQQPKYRDEPVPRYDEKERKRRDDPRYDDERKNKPQRKVRDVHDPQYDEKEGKRKDYPKYDDDEPQNKLQPKYKDKPDPRYDEKESGRANPRYEDERYEDGSKYKNKPAERDDPRYHNEERHDGPTRGKEKRRSRRYPRERSDY